MVDLPGEGGGGGGGGCKGVQRACKGGANFFQALNIICEERLPGHGFQVIEQVLGHLFHSPKLIFYCFQRHNFWEGLAVWGVAHPLPKIYK